MDSNTLDDGKEHNWKRRKDGNSNWNSGKEMQGYKNEGMHGKTRRVK